MHWIVQTNIHREAGHFYACDMDKVVQILEDMEN